MEAVTKNPPTVLKSALYHKIYDLNSGEIETDANKLYMLIDNGANRLGEPILPFVEVGFIRKAGIWWPTLPINITEDVVDDNPFEEVDWITPDKKRLFGLKYFDIKGMPFLAQFKESDLDGIFEIQIKGMPNESGQYLQHSRSLPFEMLEDEKYLSHIFNNMVKEIDETIQVSV